MTQLEFTIGDEYNHYIVPHHAYTTRFDIFYNSENVGYVENEELTPNANSEWVIHIPTDKRAYLESKNKGLVGAIFDLPTNQDGIIDKKYYIEPVAFTRIIGKDYNNTPHQIDAKGPGSYVGLKFDNEFWDVEDTEIAQGTKQLNIRIDLKRFANILKYSLAEISGAMPSGVVTDPQGISIRTCTRFPSIIVAEDNNSRPVWKDLKDITVGYAEKATNTDRLGMKTPEEFVTYENINTDITSYFDNSYEYGFRTGYDLEKNQSYVYTRAYRVHLVGDVSGDAEIHNFEDIDIECTLRDRQSYIDSLKPCPIELMGGVLDDKLVANKGIIIPIDGDHAFGDQYGSLVPLTIGDYTKIHLEFDNNEIMAKMNESRPAGVGQNASGEALFLQPEGGLVNIGCRARTNLHVNGNISTMNVEEDPGNYEPSGGNLLIVGTSDLRGNTTIGKINRPANLTVYGDTNLNGLNITKDDNGNIVFNVDNNRKYKFNIGGSTVFSLDDNTATIATTSYVDDAISNLVNSAPETLDTLGELAEAFHNSNDLVNSFIEEVGNTYSVVNHNHDNTYLKLTGGSLTGKLTTNATDSEVFQIKNINGGSYRDIVAYNNATSTRLGSIRFNAGNTDGSNSITIGVSDGINSAPSGLTVIRTVGDGVNAGKISIKGITPDITDNSTCLATTAYVKNNLNNYYTKTDIDTTLENYSSNVNSNFVTLGTTQAITGKKTFSQPLYTSKGYYRTFNNIERGNVSTEVSQTNNYLVHAWDKNAKLLGGVQTNMVISSPSSYYNFTGLFTHNLGDTTNYATLGIGYNQDGAYTQAPTPPANDSSTKIATTAYVKNNLNNYYTKTDIDTAFENFNPTGDYAPISHNQASSTITTMSGYTKAASASAIATTDTLNSAIGKLEKALDGKQASGNYAASSHNHTSNDINAMSGYTKAASVSAIDTTDSLNSAIGKLEKALDGKQASGSYLLTTGTAADSSKLGGTVAASYAKLDSPSFTGTPLATTATVTTNTTQIATTEFVNNRIATPVEKVYALTSATNITIDPANGSIFTLTPPRACAINIANMPSGMYTNYGGIITLLISKPSYTYTIEWNNKIKWMDGSAPDTLNEGYSIITFVTSDGGSTYYANVITQGV